MSESLCHPLLLAALVVASATLHVRHVAISVLSAYDGFVRFRRTPAAPSAGVPAYMRSMRPSLYGQYVVQLIY